MTEAESDSTIERITTELVRVLAPLGAAGVDLRNGDTEQFDLLLESAGITEEAVGEQYQTIEGVFVEIGESWGAIEGTILETIETGGTPSPGEIEAAVDGIEAVFRSLWTLDEMAIPVGPGGTVAEGLSDFLIAAYLEGHRPEVYAFLRLVGAISESEQGRRVTLELDAISQAIGAPEDIPEQVLGWGTDEFRASPLIRNLSTIQAALTGLHGEEVADTFKLAEDQRAVVDLSRQLGIPLFSEVDTSGQDPKLVEVGLVLAPLPGDASNPPGLALAPYGEASLGTTVELGNGWELELSSSADANDWALIAPTDDGSPGVSLRTLPGTPPIDPTALRSPSSDSGLPSIEAQGTISRTDPSSTERRQLLGLSDSIGLFIDRLSLQTTIEADGTDGRLRVELPVEGRLLVSPEGGFLTSVLPSDLGLDFSTALGWSTTDGPYLDAGGTLDVSIPLHVSLGPVELSEVYFAALSGDSGAITLEAAASPRLTIGPLDARVERMGLSATIGFPAGPDGNRGVVDVDLGFKPPDGIGLSIDSGPVTGGGILTFEPEKHRYSGGLQLQFSSWGLQVVGLLNTELPGTDGYSLLLLVTADLPPVQLGFGFVLTGIGGLAGVHRGFEKKPLGRAVRSGNLDSVLFPENVVENAEQIVTDLRAIFPPKADRHVFGPMLRLGWGTPVIITAELGVLVSVPSWKIALLGKFMLDLPDEEVALVDLNLAVVGVLDVPGKHLAIDASLYDSRLAQWTVSGDMAMRLSWGADSRFMLSVGGFHPRYTPPEGFPALDRVTASLSPPGGNPSLEYTGYLAVTPNTFQVGAAAVLDGTFGPARVHGELSFDALFRFNPFEFVVDVYAGLTVRVKGKTLSLKLDGTLSGPGPYRVRGKLQIKILLLKATVKVRAEFGQSGGTTSLPTANVLPDLLRELETPANWSAQAPEDDDQLVTLRDPAATAEEGPPRPTAVLAHPLGTLGVRQQVVPLDVEIEKYGSAKPSHTRFTVSELSVTGAGRDLGGQERLRERFAPARFRKLTDDEKLESEPFERLPAGRRVTNGAVHYAGRDDRSLLAWATLDYESSVIDDENEAPRVTATAVTESWDGRLDLSTGHALAAESAVGRAGTRTSGSARYANPDRPGSVAVGDHRFVVAWRASLERLDADDNPPEGSTRIEAEDRLAAYADDHPGTDPDELLVVGVHELAGGEPA